MTEGADHPFLSYWPQYPYRNTFRGLRNGLNAQRGYGWKANPWMVACTFRPMLGNVEWVAAEIREGAL